MKVLLAAALLVSLAGFRCVTAGGGNVVLLLQGPAKSTSYREWMKAVKRGLEEAIIEGYKNMKRGVSVTSMSQCPLIERSYDSKIWIEVTRHAVDSLDRHEILFHVKMLRANRKDGQQMGKEVFMASSDVLAAMNVIHFQQLMSVLSVKVIGYKEANQAVTPTPVSKLQTTLAPTRGSFELGYLESGDSPSDNSPDSLVKATGRPSQSSGWEPTSETKATDGLATSDVPHLIESPTDQDDIGSGDEEDSDVEVSGSGAVTKLNLIDEVGVDNKNTDAGSADESGWGLDSLDVSGDDKHIHQHSVRSVPIQMKSRDDQILFQKHESTSDGARDTFIADWSDAGHGDDIPKHQTVGVDESADHNDYRQLLKKCFPRYVNRLMNSMLRTEHCTIMHYLGRHTATGTKNIVRAMKAEGYTSHDCVSVRPVFPSSSISTESTTSEPTRVIVTKSFGGSVIRNGGEVTEDIEQTESIREIEFATGNSTNPSFEVQETKGSNVAIALYAVIALVCLAVVVVIVSIIVYVHNRKKLEIEQGIPVSTKVRILSCNTANVEVASDIDSIDSIDSCSEGGLQLDWDETSIDIPAGEMDQEAN